MTNTIYIHNGYAGSPSTVRATIDGKEYIIEAEHACEYLLKAIESKGFKTHLKPRQQYMRLTIND